MEVRKIRDFLEGNSDPDEVHEIMTWIHSEDAQQVIETELSNTKDNFSYSDSDKLFESIKAKVHSYSNDDREDNLRSINHINRPTTLKRVALAAAASIVFVLLGYSVYYNSLNDQIAEVASLSTGVVKRAELGQKLTIQLNDGSVVKLNAGSELRYDPASFSENRYVEIEGEAYFEISKDTLRPFRVNANDLFTVEVLGTQFNINAYAHLNTKAVTLTEGKVKIEEIKSDEEIYLVPGEQFSLNKADLSFEKRQVDVSQYIAWKDGVLSFKREPLGLVFQKLSYWYGVQFDFEGRLLDGDCKLDGEFNNQPLSRVLKSMATVYEFEYEIRDNMVKVRGDTCK